MQYKRLTLFAGHYGSGKTNIALNYARWLKRQGLPVTIADLDIVNPYFRTKDSEAALKEEGIGLICSEFANSNVDLPAMPKEVYGLVNDPTVYGVLDIGGDNAVKSFREKKQADGAPINAGYMVLNPEIFDYIEGDATVFERDPLEKLAGEGQLMSYMHRGFWQCMDNVREKEMLEKLIASGKAPWMKWEV